VHGYAAFLEFVLVLFRIIYGSCDDTVKTDAKNGSSSYRGFSSCIAGTVRPKCPESIELRVIVKLGASVIVVDAKIFDPRNPIEPFAAP
jgi:hypothetical protein